MSKGNQEKADELICTVCNTPLNESGEHAHNVPPDCAPHTVRLALPVLDPGSAGFGMK